MPKDLKRGGFTLVELLIAVTLLTLALTAISGVVVSAYKTWASQDQIVAMQQNVQSAVEFVARELRASTTITCMDSTAPCATAGDQITFSSANDINTRIFSWSSADNILRFSDSAGAPSRTPLAENITALILTAYDVNNALTTNVAKVKRIDIVITGQSASVDFSTKAHRTYTLAATAMRRNP